MFRRVAFVFVLVTTFPLPSCTNKDNLVRLLDTLKTMQRVSCDDQNVSLTCPTGTAVNIQVAQYGKVARGGYSCLLDRQSVAVEVVGPDKCLWPNTMQYALLQSVVEACQKKPSCQFSTSPKAGLVDPCPHVRKFVEVAYKCKPTEFRSRQICEGEVTRLACKRYHRLAIFEAQFGRQANEALTCPQPQTVQNETCFVPLATEKVMQLCHGKRRCDVVASKRVFGDLCHPSSRKFLKVIHTCVPLGVLAERYESAAENDEIPNTHDDDQGEAFEEPMGSSDFTTIVPAAPVAKYPYDDRDVPSTKVESSDVPASPVANQPFESHVTSQSNEEVSGQKTKANVLLYIGIAVLIFIILTVILFGVRFYIIRRSSIRRSSKTGDLYPTQVPSNVFNDAVSDIDNDIDVAHISGTFYDHPDMILYSDVPGSRGTMRPMRPMSTIYPCAGTSMYGTVDYVPRCEKADAQCERDRVISPKSLSRFSTPNMHYG